MKLLEGYVENRTKEAALAAMMLALFFVSRTFKIQATPAVALDFTGIFIYTAASLFSWPYTVLFSLATMYQGSTFLPSVLAWFVGTQVVFFLSKIVKRKWIPYILPLGEFVANPFYGLALHATGFMDFRVFMISTFPIWIWIMSISYVGGAIIWKALTEMKVIEPLATS